MLGVAVLVLVGACQTGEDRGPADIIGARSSSPTTLAIDIASCHGNPEVVRVHETATEVRLEIIAALDTVDDCADIVDIELDAPLADRRVLDLGSDDEITIARND